MFWWMALTAAGKASSQGAIAFRKERSKSAGERRVRSSAPEHMPQHLRRAATVAVQSSWARGPKAVRCSSRQHAST